MKRCLAFILCLAPIALLAQAPAGDLDPATLLKPLGESWPTYSGDYTGRRYSALTQINQTTVKNLGLAWLSRGFVLGSDPTGRGGAGGGPGGGGGRRGPWRCWRGDSADRRGRGHGRVQRRRAGGDPRIDSDGRWRALRDLAGQSVGRRRARRIDPLAVLLEDAGRHAHRQPRRRHVAQLPLHGNAG